MQKTERVTDEMVEAAMAAPVVSGRENYVRRVIAAALSSAEEKAVEEPLASFAWNEGVESAPYSTTVLATYFDMEVGEWIIKIFVAERPTAPFTHWMWMASPGEAAELPWRNMDSAPRTGEEFIARVDDGYPAFSCFWNGEAFVHYDKDDGFIRYPVAEWLPMPTAAQQDYETRIRSALVDVPAVEEPVAIYHGNGLIDCGDAGHHKIELLKLIPAGSKLFAHPPRSSLIQSEEGWSMLRLAVAAVLEADTEFRAQMMPGWEGDPLSDEIDGRRRIFNSLSTSPSPYGGDTGDGSATTTKDGEHV